MRIREQRPGKQCVPRPLHRSSRKRPLLAARLRVERLEARSLLAGSALGGLGGSQVEAEPNDTLDLAQVLGDLSTLTRTDVVGSVGNGPDGAAGVDWYSFTLDGPAHVSLDLQPRGSDHPLNGVLSLYNNDQFDFQDLYDPLGYRLLEQETASGGADPRIERDLGPGTYEVAVSGAGNLDFHPLVAGSGLAGATGNYDLQLGAAPLPFGPTDGPAVLTSDPAPNAVIDTSPFVIRLDFGSALDPSTVIADQTVRLTYNPTGSFGNGNDQDVALAWTNVGVGGTELQLAPAAPLAPGFYKVSLAGDSTAGTPVADLNGIPLGASASNPQGLDYTETFQVDGIEGNVGTNPPADDTPAGAHDLGNLTAQSNIVQVAGAIGADPYYDNSDPAHNPANDVNLYHFQINGPGRYAVVAEVFAGRIGSPLDPGVSLYELDPVDHTLHFLAGNNNTENPITATDSSVPLYIDSMLSQGLTAGDYYLAVSSGFNTPSPAEFQWVGAPGLFNPNVTHSGQIGSSTGPYVLNVLVHPDPDPPQVVSTSLTEGATLDEPPTQMTVQFSEPVNLEQLGYVNYLATNSSTVASVYILGSDGTKYYPRVNSYDPSTNEFTLLLLDRLPAGSFTLHLSGPGGLDDLGGNPLVGNDPSGDFVVHFTVAATDPVQPAASGNGEVIEAQPDPAGNQDLGVLFPRELHDGLMLDYTPPTDAGQGPGAAQQYQFTVIQDNSYFFTLQGSELPPGAQMTLTEDSGHFVTITHPPGDQLWYGELQPGSYQLTVAGLASDTPYQIQFILGASPGNPVPLVAGPAPALQLHFDVIAPPVTPVGPPAPGDGTGTGTPSGPGGGTTSGVANSPGGGGTSLVFGPSPSAPVVTIGQTASPGVGNVGAATPGPILVTLNLPANASVSPSAGPVGGLSPDVSTGTTVLAAELPAAVAVNTITNLASANLGGLSIGPVGGVPPNGGAVAAAQTVQVSVQMPANAPVPMGLVSLVTLTQAGDLGETVGPNTPSGLDAMQVVTPDLPPVPVAAPPPAPPMAGPAQQVGEVLQRIAAWWARPTALPREVTAAAGNVESANQAGQLTATPPGTAIGLVGGEGQGPSTVGDAEVVDVGSLATTEGPWFFLVAALGVVTVYARWRRKARRTAAPSGLGIGCGAPSARSLFPFWDRRASRNVPHWTRARQTPHAAATRSIACPRPRHMTNP